MIATRSAADGARLQASDLVRTPDKKTFS